jgi:hypothetical protein
MYGVVLHSEVGKRKNMQPWNPINKKKSHWSPNP